MSDVAGVNAVQQAIDVLLENNWRGDLRDQLEDVKALLRNRQELAEMIRRIEELDSVGLDFGEEIEDLYAHAKELDND